MSTQEMIQVLSEEAKNHKATNAVLHLFALRKRTRSVITVRSLDLRMKREGFNFDRNEYIRVLKVLERSGVGKLQVDAKGRVRALTDIRTTLQSLGKAVVGQEKDLKGFNKRNRFAKVIPIVDAPKALTSVVSKITIDFNGKPIVIDMPEGLSGEEIAGLLVKFQDKRPA